MLKVKEAGKDKDKCKELANKRVGLLYVRGNDLDFGWTT